MAVELISGLGAIKTAFDMTKALKDINDTVIRNGAIIELQDKILAAREAQSTLLERISQLEAENAQLKEQQNKLDRYQLKDYGDQSFAYELREPAANGEPMHRACAACYQDGKISILQFSAHSEGQEWFDCPRCKSHQHFGVRVPYQPPRITYDDF